jgi:hypothetical protein
MKTEENNPQRSKRCATLEEVAFNQQHLQKFICCKKTQQLPKTIVPLET